LLWCELVGFEEVSDALDDRPEWVVIAVGHFAHLLHEVHVVDLAALVFLEEPDEAVKVVFFDAL